MSKYFWLFGSPYREKKPKNKLNVFRDCDGRTGRIGATVRILESGTCHKVTAIKPFGLDGTALLLDNGHEVLSHHTRIERK